MIDRLITDTESGMCWRGLPNPASGMPVSQCLHIPDLRYSCCACFTTAFCVAERTLRND